MKRIFFAAALGLAALMGQVSAHAQSYESYGYSSPSARFQFTPQYYYPQYGGYGGWGYHSSTAAAGYLNGLGQLYRGVGEYNVANSIAAGNWEMARTANLQNNILERNARVAVYASMRAGQNRRQEEYRKRNETLNKFKAAQPVERLTSNQLDRDTGEVEWPAILADAKYSTERANVEQALALKFRRHEVSVTQSDETLVNTVNEFRQKLEDNKADYRPSDFYAARAFLNRMKGETSNTNNAPEARLASSL